MNEAAYDSNLSQLSGRSTIYPDIITRRSRQEYLNPDQVREEIGTFCSSLRRLSITPLQPNTVQHIILEGSPKIVRRVPGASVGRSEDIIIHRKGYWTPDKRTVTIYDDPNWRESLYEELAHAQWSQQEGFHSRQSTQLLEAYAEWLKTVAVGKGDIQRIKQHFIGKGVEVKFRSEDYLLFEDILTHDYSIIGKPPDAALLHLIFVNYGYSGVLKVMNIGAKTLPRIWTWSEALYALRKRQSGFDKILEEHYGNFQNQFNALFPNRMSLQALTRLAHQYYDSL